MTETSANAPQAYRPRLADAALAYRLSGLPAVWITGPRGCGKTTTALRQAASVVHLDRPADRARFAADPDAALQQQAEPVLLDEWQDVPEVLGAVKRAVDTNSRPGRFILTGSVNATVTTNAWPATGRVNRLPMWPMTQAEILGHALGVRSVVERLWDAKPGTFGGVTPPLTITQYLGLAARGGLPDAVVNRSPQFAEQRLVGYADELIHRDAALVRAGIDSERFAGYVQAVAACTAGVIDEIALIDAAHINRRTADAYWNVLENLFVADAVPAWWSSQLTRLEARPKRYLTDSGLATALTNSSPDEMTASPAWVGQMLDTWVAMQLRPEILLSPRWPRLHHLRTKGGQHEADLLVEFRDGSIAGIEVKATSAPSRDDARHLKWLRDELGDRFRIGLVLHTGPHEFQLDDRIVAAPISTFWLTGASAPSSTN